MHSIRYDVRSRSCGTLDLFQDGELRRTGIPEASLRSFLAPCHIYGERYQSVKDQLTGSGRATIQIPIVKTLLVESW
jgi:hypothetical protein